MGILDVMKRDMTDPAASSGRGHKTSLCIKARTSPPSWGVGNSLEKSS